MEFIKIEYSERLKSSVKSSWRFKKKSLHEAVKQNEAELVEKLLSEGVDVDSKDARGNTPLQYALACSKNNSHLKIVQLLLEHKADVNARTDWDDAPLHIVIKYTEGNTYIINLLLDNGADINAKNYLEYTPLHLAVIKLNFITVDLLLSRGADVNAHDCNNDTPLYIAAKGKKIYERLATIKILLKYGADVNAENHREETAIHRAFAEHEIVKILLDHGANVNTVCCQGISAVSRAVCNLKLLKMLLSAPGVDVNKKNSKLQETPLHYAALRSSEKDDKLEQVKILLEHQADVNAQNEHGNTPLHLLAISEEIHKETIQLLLDSGADVNAKNNNGLTPLHLAAENNKLEVLGQLLSNGADANAKDNDDSTPLHWATMKSADDSHFEVVKLLLENQADVNAPNKKGNTALHFLTFADEISVKTTKFLINNGARGDLKNECGFSAILKANEEYIYSVD